MAYLTFNKAELVNLEYSLKREIFATNRAGGYTNTTIVCCNTRKYHGLLVVPIDELGGLNHVLLSGVDETVIQHDKSFNLGIHRYGAIYEPRGHKYIVDFEIDKNSVVTYRVGGVLLKKEILLMHNKDQVLLRYTLLDAHSPTTLRIKPFLAFREAHRLTKANMEANVKYVPIENGVCSCLYQGFPPLYMQLDAASEFVSCPDWYYGVTYQEEARRGFDAQEDLFVPGYFEFSIQKGQSVIFSASVQREHPKDINKLFDAELAMRPARDSYRNCLEIAAKQFIVHRNDEAHVMAGYPWNGYIALDTFVALPGLTLSHPDGLATCKAVLDTMMQKYPEKIESADASLWYFWTLQKYLEVTNDPPSLWREFGTAMKAILSGYELGANPSILLHENGLIWAEEAGRALTWMNAEVNGVPVTPRSGYQVDVNALWYNAVMFALDLARQSGDSEFVQHWEQVPERTKESFMRAFWVETRKHLADYVGPEGQNIFMRPNQLFACSLPYSPISDEVKAMVLKAIESELLTPKGLRTLAPKNPLYIGFYEGNQEARDKAYHQGTIRPWLIGHYIEACFKLHGVMFADQATELLKGFEEDIAIHGVGSIAEVYDGDPPHQPHGCPSSAAGVAEVLRSLRMIELFKKQKNR
ncbi:MAG: amylo-alpha-1,6-glucosidase [Prevotellaceae bacterium]|jgi:predicted glycogen debranching enzyme|nr:amylo-alpha-1,6-glucosidase [Prevotellaceae bacterium]